MCTICSCGCEWAGIWLPAASVASIWYMFSPCATVLRVIPGQISIVGFCGFMAVILGRYIFGANLPCASTVLVCFRRTTALGTGFCLGKCSPQQSFTALEHDHKFQICYQIILITLAIFYSRLARCRDENTYIVSHNSVRNNDCDFLICAESIYIAGSRSGHACSPGR